MVGLGRDEEEEESVEKESVVGGFELDPDNTITGFTDRIHCFFRRLVSQVL